jgi:hypothetical protein
VCLLLLDSLGDEGLDVVDLQGAFIGWIEVGDDVVHRSGEEGEIGDGVDLPSRWC